MPSLVEQPTPPQPVGARMVTFPGGAQGTGNLDAFAVRKEKERLWSLWYLRKRRRAERDAKRG